MIELISVAFAPVNVVFTVLLLLTGLYWVTVILGVLDINLFHIDLADSGPEIDADVDADLDGMEMGIGHSILHFFYIGEVPTMILVSILILSLWSFSILGNYYLNPGGLFLVAIPVFIGNLAASVFVMKLFGMPLRRLYALLNKDYNAPADIMGRICRIVTTRVTNDRVGQAEVATKGAPILLNVLSQDEHVFRKGDEAVIVALDGPKGTYLIASVNLEK